jgi:hypothetical protein
VLGQAKTDQARIETLQEVVRRREKAQGALQAVDLRVGDPAGYRGALLAFAEKLPESPEAVDFKRVSEEAKCWEEIIEWNALVDHWNQQDTTRLTPSQVAALSEECRQFVAAHAGFPHLAAVEQKLAHLQAIARRSGPDGKLHMPLNELFTDPLIATLWMVEAKDQNGGLVRYYLVAPPPDPVDNQASVQFAHMTDFARVANKQARVKVGDITYSGEAPQSRVAKRAMDILARSNDDLWESMFGRILVMISGDEQLEPILKVLLLQRVLEIACGGSESLRLAFGPYQEILESVTIDPTVPWMDLKNEDTRRTRELASELLHRLPPMQQVLRRAAANLTAFKAAPGPKYEWVGWLEREPSGVWHCRTPKKPGGGGKLLVARKADGKPGFEWIKVGDWRGDSARLAQSPNTALVAGRPVFVERELGK